MGAAASRQGDAGRGAAREHTKRCRERRRLMKEAVRLRRQLAASHAGYLRSLGLAASALARFAVGEQLPVSDHTPPAVIVHRPAAVAPSSPPPLLRFIDRRRGEQEDGAAADEVAGGPSTASSSSWGTRTEGAGGEETRVEVRHRSLAEVVAGLEEYFLKASVAGDALSSLLETTTAEFHGGSRSFLGVLCCLSALSVAHDRIDSINGGQRHSSTLQQLLAWEKKLYREVKARERLQIRHDKKRAELQDQEYSRKIGVDIDKLKAEWHRASAQLATASQAVDATAASVAELRDGRLARQLLGLCHATLDMWRAAARHHEAQSAIAQQLRGLSCGRARAASMEEPTTTEIHHGATRALEAAMAAWGEALGQMAKHHRDYAHAIHGWLRLTLAPPPDGAAAEASPVSGELADFVHRWAQALDRVHCADALRSIKGFAGAARALHALQGDELRAARRVRRRSREVDRKSRMLRQVEKSYYDSYASASLWHLGWGSRRQWRDDARLAHDARSEVAQRQEEIAVCRRRVEDEMRRHAKAVDAMRSSAVTGVQGKLPAVFQAMAAFSASLASALETVCRQQAAHACTVG